MARRKARTAKLASAQSALAPLTPADLEQRYNFPPGAGAGQSIAIGEFGGGYFAEDVAAYCNKFQRPVPSIKPIAVDAPAYTLQQIYGASQEAARRRYGRQHRSDDGRRRSLPDCVPGLTSRSIFRLSTREGGSTSSTPCIAAKPAVLSISWGLAEDDPDWASNAITAINDRLNMLRLVGVTACISFR